MERLLTILMTISVIGMLTFAFPVMAQDACEGQIGAGYGLCTAAGHLGCGTESEKNTDACVQIEDSFLKNTGEMPPWLAPPTCPCFTSAEANEIADGNVTYCSFHPTDSTWASIIGTDGATGIQETMHTAANPDPYWQRCSFEAVGSTNLFLRHLTDDEVTACYNIITTLIADKGLEPVSGSNVCQPFK